MALRVILGPGDVFAGYTIEQLLGGGGMGNVYRARDPDLPRSVALKLLHRDLTADDYVRARFELEAAHAAGLEHPNIVTVYRRGREDDQLWIAMQFVDTTDVAAALDNGPLDPAHAVHTSSETAKALDYAHGAGVLHRDIKPANILLERSRRGRPGRVLLADFGIAKALAETGHLTRTGMLVASLQYASPEQRVFVGLHTVSPAHRGVPVPGQHVAAHNRRAPHLCGGGARRARGRRNRADPASRAETYTATFGGRLARVGAALLAFALFTYAWAIRNGTSLADKRDEMTLVALVGAALLLAGCWRGLSPSNATLRGWSGRASASSCSPSWAI